MATGNSCAFTLCTSIVRFHVWALGDRSGIAVRRLCGDCTKTAQCQCSCRKVSTDSTRKWYGARAGSIQRLRGEGAVTLQGQCPQKPSSTIWFLCLNVDHLKSSRKVSARPSHDVTYDMSTGYGTTIFFLILPKSLRSPYDFYAQMRTILNLALRALSPTICLRAMELRFSFKFAINPH